MGLISTTLPISQARSNFYTLIDEVSNKLKRFTITKRGKIQAVIVHPEEVAAWEETMDILADKKLVGKIIRSESERKSGNVVSEKRLLKELKISSQNLESASS